MFGAPTERKSCEGCEGLWRNCDAAVVNRAEFVERGFAGVVEEEEGGNEGEDWIRSGIGCGRRNGPTSSGLALRVENAFFIHTK